MKPYKLIILDRDGVINHDSDAYIKSADEWAPIAGSLGAIGRLQKAGVHVAIATNQSGIGRGFYDESVLDSMHQKMQTLLAEQGGDPIEHIAFCPHHPDDGCECRKPKIQMLQTLADAHNVNADEVVFIGDSSSDYQCAQNFGCDFILVLTGKGLKTLNKLAGTALCVHPSLTKWTDDFLQQHH